VPAKIKCTDVLDADGNPVNGSAWSMWALLRITNDEGTVIDTPGIAALDAGAVRDGKISGKLELINAPGLVFRPCAEVEVLHLQLRDPDDQIFATMGSGTR
jgi:hypothetical protein